MLINGDEVIIRLHGQAFHCALDVTMHYLGGKWKAVILWYLRGGPRRFSALRKCIPDITEKMLSLQLKNLEANGLIERTVLAEKPLTVDYRLTPFGQSIMPVVEAMAKWGRELGEAQGEWVSVESRKS